MEKLIRFTDKAMRYLTPITIIGALIYLAVQLVILSNS